MPSINSILLAVSILLESDCDMQIRNITIRNRTVDMGTTNKTGKAKEIKILINDLKGENQ